MGERVPPVLPPAPAPPPTKPRMPRVLWIYRDPTWVHEGFLVTYSGARALKLAAQGMQVERYERAMLP